MHGACCRGRLDGRSGGGDLVPQRSGGSLLAGLTSLGSGGGGGIGDEDGGGDPRLAERTEYRPPSERSLTRPNASYGSRGGSAAPSAEPSANGSGKHDGAGDDDGAGGGRQSNASLRPSSAPARRRPGSAGSAASGGLAASMMTASGGMPSLPMSYGKLPLSPSARQTLPLKSAMLGFKEEDSSAQWVYPDPNAAAPMGAGGGSRPASAGRAGRSFGPRGFRVDSQRSASQRSGWV